MPQPALPCTFGPEAPGGECLGGGGRSDGWRCTAGGGGSLFFFSLPFLPPASSDDSLLAGTQGGGRQAGDGEPRSNEGAGVDRPPFLSAGVAPS